MTACRYVYLYHSGFAVETPSHLLVFDYYRDPSGWLDRRLQQLASEQPARSISVFASHSHPDHFNPAIFSWASRHPGITYLLSDDIPDTPPQGAYHHLAPYAETACGSLRIKTYGSTDAGVSFLVEADGLRIFHAGDLNWWHWSGESLEEQRQAEAAFKAEMEKLKGEQIDLAFFPVDSRQGEYYSLGAEYFVSLMSPKLLVPMHFFDSPDISAAFCDRAQTLAINTVAISRAGEEFTWKSTE